MRAPCRDAQPTCILAAVFQHDAAQPLAVGLQKRVVCAGKQAHGAQAACGRRLGARPCLCLPPPLLNDPLGRRHGLALKHLLPASHGRQWRCQVWRRGARMHGVNAGRQRHSPAGLPFRRGGGSGGSAGGGSSLGGLLAALPAPLRSSGSNRLRISASRRRIWMLPSLLPRSAWAGVRTMRASGRVCGSQGPQIVGDGAREMHG